MDCNIEGIESRIDHAFTNSNFLMKYTNQEVHYMPSSVSDHTPLIIKVGDNVRGGGRPFRFFNYLIEHVLFDQVVKKA